MAFLTLMAPMIAVTYPIDKIKDGHAQAFNAWLVEYMFNALLQPIHLIIYVVLIGSAMTLAQSNFLYTIVALGFIVPAEKLLRSMFGLNKAQTAGGMGGFAKGALASQVLNTMKSGGSSAKSIGSKSSNSSSSSKSSSSSSAKPRQTKGLEAYVSEEENVPKGNNSSDKEARLGSLDEGSEGSEGSDGSSKRLSKEEMTRLDSEYGKSDSTSLPKEEKESNQRLDKASKGTNSGNSVRPKKSRQEKKKIKGVKRTAAWAGIRTGAKGLKYVGKKLPRAALKTAGTIAGLGVGAALSVATGDASYLAGGAMAGRALGNKAANLGTGIASGTLNAGRGIRSTYRELRLGAQGAASKERFDEFISNKDNINHFKEEYGVSGKEAKAMIKQGREFIEAGYTDPEDVSRLMKMKEASGGASNDQIMAADQMAAQLKIDDFLDSKKSAQLEQNFTNQMKIQAKGKITDERAKELARGHMNSMRVSKGLSPITASKVPVKKVQNPDTTKTSETSSTPRKASGTRTSSRTSSTPRKASSARTSSKTSSNTTKRGKK